MPVWLEIEIAMIAVIAPVLGWLITKLVSLNNRITKLEIHQNGTKDSLDRIEDKIDKLTDKITDIDVRLARVETRYDGDGRLNRDSRN